MRIILVILSVVCLQASTISPANLRKLKLVSEDNEDYPGLLPMYGEEAAILGQGEGPLLVAVSVYSFVATWINIQVIQFLYNYFYSS